MAEAIPLRATLRVQRVAVIVGDILREGFDRVLEGLTAKSGLLGHIERKAVHPVSMARLTQCQDRGAAAYSSRTISPVWISAADALTRCGVRRFNLPSYKIIP